MLFRSHACDTAYHDIQHVLEVTLAMARLVGGYGHDPAKYPLLEREHFELGVVVALFHDVGYIRATDDTFAQNGAEYTLTRVSRGARFLRGYLPRIGMTNAADVAAELIHFTGFERSPHGVNLPSLAHLLIGNLLGTADIVAQMSDRCYLEKCRDRLYPEYVAGGIARKKNANGAEEVVFKSPDDLISKTPRFYQGAMRRLTDDLGNGLRYAERYFDGRNPYQEGIEKNMRFAERLSQAGDFSPLKRVPPDTLN